MQTSPLASDLLSGIAEIAGHTGESERRTRYLCDTGQIPAFQIGNRWYARKSELDRRYSASRFDTEAE
jgi:Helix-turn-helix domain